MEDLPVPEIDLGLCDRCGYCITACPTHTLRLTDRGPEIVDREQCTFCAVCEDICPRGAIRCAYEIRWAAPGIWDGTSIPPV
jgi:hydrogenase-4 component H